MQVRPARAVHELLEEVLTEVAELERTLATHPSDSKLARQRFAMLSQTVARVDAKVLQLEEEVAQMRHFAYHDALTGLPNRSLLLDRLDRTVAQAARHRRHAAVLLLDLDDFKGVNDRFGHALGDHLLKQVAQRLIHSTRDADTTARYGGDEFVILLPDVEGEQGAAEVAQKIHARLAEPFVIGRVSVAVTACIGIAVYPADGATPDELIESADVAMYGAKDHGHLVAASLRMALRSLPAGIPGESAPRRRSTRGARTD